VKRETPLGFNDKKDSGRQRPGSAMAYGKHRKRKAGDDDDINDRCMDLEKENLTLKEKENLLEREIIKYYHISSLICLCRMNTKLRRIEELAKAGK
jgi:hypothetical protein